MQETCPKCNAEKQGEACTRCGLVFSKFKKEVLDEGIPEELIKLWSEVDENWHEKSRHAIFTERAMALNASGYAAACYRRRGNDPRAKAYIEQLNERLEQMLLVGASPSRKKQTRGRWAVSLFLVILFAGVALIYLFYSSFTGIR